MAMTPQYQITVNNADITKQINTRLLSVNVTDEIGIVSDTLSICLDNRNGVLEIPPCGATITLSMGYEELYPMGTFIVDEIEISSPPSAMTITARASDPTTGSISSFNACTSRSWEQQTISAIVQEIASIYGMESETAPQYGNILINTIEQTDESDCAFLQRLATEYGGAIKIAGSKILLIEPFSGKFPNGTSMPVIKIKESEIISFKMRISQRNAYGSVSAKYYDFDAATEQEITVGDKSPVYTIRDIYSSAQQAQLSAQTKLNEIITGSYSLSLEIIGNALLGAESVVDISTRYDEIRGRWVIKSARHCLSNSGYKTSLELNKTKG